MFKAIYPVWYPCQYCYPHFRPDPTKRAGIGRRLHHRSTWTLPAANHISAVPGLWRTTVGQPQSVCGEVRHAWRPGPELSLWQRWGHPQCVVGEGVHRGEPLLWGHETGALNKSRHLRTVTIPHVCIGISHESCAFFKYPHSMTQMFFRGPAFMVFCE